MKNLKSITALLFASLLILSCEKDDETIDTTKPTVTISEPHNEDAFKPGDEIHFEAEFSDNIALESYKIDIHINADGHAHKPSTITEEDDHEAWDYEFIDKLSGASQQVMEHFAIPTQVNGKPIEEGEYDFGIYTIDASGNQSVVWRKIDIMDGATTHDH